MAKNDVFKFKYKTSNMEINVKNFFLESSKNQIKKLLNMVKEAGKETKFRTILHEKIRECEEVINSVDSLYSKCEDILSDYCNKGVEIVRPSQITKIKKTRDNYVFALKILMKDDKPENILEDNIEKAHSRSEDEVIQSIKNVLDELHVSYRDVQPGEEGGFYYIDENGNRQKYKG